MIPGNEKRGKPMKAITSDIADPLNTTLTEVDILAGHDTVFCLAMNIPLWACHTRYS